MKTTEITDLSDAGGIVLRALEKPKPAIAGLNSTPVKGVSALFLFVFIIVSNKADIGPIIKYLLKTIRKL